MQTYDLVGQRKIKDLKTCKASVTPEEHNFVKSVIRNNSLVDLANSSSSPKRRCMYSKP